MYNEDSTIGETILQYVSCRYCLSFKLTTIYKSKEINFSANGISITAIYMVMLLWVYLESNCVGEAAIYLINPPESPMTLICGVKNIWFQQRHVGWGSYLYSSSKGSCQKKDTQAKRTITMPPKRDCYTIPGKFH